MRPFYSMRYETVTKPKQEPVALKEAADHMRVFHRHEDAVISGLIRAATEWAESYTNSFFVERVIDLYLPGFEKLFYVDLSPVKSIDSIYYTDSDGEEHLIEPDDYRVMIDSHETKVEAVESWPCVGYRCEPVRIRCTVGHGAAHEVPDTIKVAIKLLVEHLYRNRGATSPLPFMKEVPFGIRALLGLHVSAR